MDSENREQSNQNPIDNKRVIRARRAPAPFNNHANEDESLFFEKKQESTPNTSLSETPEIQSGAQEELFVLPQEQTPEAVPDSSLFPENKKEELFVLPQEPIPAPVKEEYMEEESEEETAVSSDAPSSDIPENAGEAQKETKQEEKLPMVLTAFDWLKTLLFSLVTVLFFFTLLFRGVNVNGNSMNDTLQNEDYLIISDLFYTPKTGDIIVAQSESYMDGKESLIKRVIATGGQTVRIDFDQWLVWVDGELLEEDYIKRDSARSMNSESMAVQNGIAEITVDEGCLFVMGDNRNDSLDSRSKQVGLINEKNVMGRVLFRVYPFSHFGGVD